MDPCSSISQGCSKQADILYYFRSMKKLILSTAFICIHICAFTQISWNAPMDAAPASSGNMHPRIVTDASGDPLILWYNASRAMFTRWNGTAFEAPRLLHPGSLKVAGAGWMGPDITAHGDTVYAVFKETPEDEGVSWCVHSYDGGITFSNPVKVEQLGNDLSRFPTVTTDASGNPIVAFMKFNSSFGDARWVVTRSDDYGNIFSPDVLASEWSGGASEACDCCPGSIVASGDTVAMLYRDNNNHVRDTWAGFSTDGGDTFNEGMNIDQQNWTIHACPASGPDGVVLGDTLYSVFMSGANGKSRVYVSRTSLTGLSSTGGTPLADDDNIALQNFPRISGDGNALGVVWKQVVNNNDELVLLFTNDLSRGLPAVYDTVDLERTINADISVRDGNVFVVWEDNASGTVKFRAGTYEVTTSTSEVDITGGLKLYPNPSADIWTVEGPGLESDMSIEIINTAGSIIGWQKIENNGGRTDINNLALDPGVYFLRIMDKGEVRILRALKL